MARQMKDSGIEWIGNIPNDWEIRRNKTLFNCSKEIVGTASKETQLLSLTTQGVKTKSQDAIGGKVPESFDTYQTVMPDDIVMCLFDLDCSAVFSGISPYYGMISPAYKILKCKSAVLPKYADYWFRFVFDGRKFKSYAKNLRYTLNYDEFAVLPFALPNVLEQGKIVSYLDKICSEIDVVISKTKATIEEYKKLKQSIITDTVTKGIHGNREIKETGIKWIGSIPNNWSVRKLKTFASLISKGATPKDISNEQNPIYNIRFLKSENIVENQLKSVPKFYIEEHIHLGELKRSALTVDDILFVIAGASIGKVAIMNTDLLPSNTNQAVSFIRVMPKYSAIKKYIWYVLQSDMIKTYISLFSVQSAQPNISMENLGNFRMPYADDNEEISEMVEYLDSKCAEIDTLIAKKTALLEEMETYKKSVIYEYVTGKKEVE